MRFARFALVAGLLLGVAAFAGVGIPESAQSQSAGGGGREIDHGQQDRRRPDGSGPPSFWFGVQTEGRTAASAMAANEAEMRRTSSPPSAAPASPRPTSRRRTCRCRLA